MFWPRLVWWCFVALVLGSVLMGGAADITSGRAHLLEGVPLAAIAGCIKLVFARIHYILTIERLNY